MYNPQLQRTANIVFHPLHLSIMYPRQTSGKRIKINQLYASSCQIVSQSEHQLYIGVMSTLAKTSSSYQLFTNRECFKGSGDIHCGEKIVGGDVGLVGYHAGQKFRAVRQAIVQHTDAANCTKEVHKVLYLIFQYLETIAITSPQPMSVSTSQKNNNTSSSSSSSSYKQNYFRQWLISASNLFNKQLQNPPIDGLPYPRPNPQGPSKRNRKYFTSSPHTPKTSTHDMDTQRLTNKTKDKQKQKDTYSCIKKDNNYYYLLQMLEEYQLEQLVQNMEILASNVNLIFDDVGIYDQLVGKQIGRMRNNVVGRIQGILEMIIRKIRLHDKFGTREVLLVDPDLGFVKSANIVHVFQQEQVSKGVETNCEDQRKNLPFEQYQSLSRVLRCITGILLGNQTTIANYARDNIYLYLALMLMYSQTQPFFTSPQTTQSVLQHLQKIHHVKLSRPSSSLPCSLNQTHSYLLQLISLPLPPCLSSQSLMTSSTDDRPLALHYFFQDTIAYFRGYEFYAYLIISVMFNMGFANSQLCRLDQEYESNIQSQLLLASIGEPVDRKQTIMVKNKLLSDALEGERQLNRFDSLSFKSSQQLNPIRQKSHEQSQWQSAIRPLESPNRQKLFLATLSFYRNILHRSRVNKQLKLQYKIDFKQFGTKQQSMMRQQLDSKLSNQMLPLHELINNLWKCCFSFRPFQSQAQIRQLRQLSKYAIEAQIAQQFLDYLKQLLSAIMHIRPNDWIIDEQTLELMQIQLEVNLFSNLSIQQNLSYNTFTFQLFHSSYLTACTLNNPFNYALLAPLSRITGINSTLYQQSEDTARQLFSFFRIFFQLQNLTKRGNWNDTNMPMNIEIQENSAHNGNYNGYHQNQIFKFDVENNELKHAPDNDKINEIKLKNTLYRLHKLQEVLSHSNNQGCGEVARVAWQILQDYQALKADLNKEIELKPQQNRLLSEAGEKAGEIISKVRQFIETMRYEGYTSHEMNKFRKLLY